MTGFCIQTISPEATLRGRHGILRAHALAITSDARAVVTNLLQNAHTEVDDVRQNAQSEADRIVQDARAEADGVLQEARTEAKRIVQEARAEARTTIDKAEENVFQQAAELLQSLETANETILDRVQDMVVDLAQALFDRLVMESTPREKIEASLRRIRQEAPPKLVNPLLRIHPDDAELVSDVDWEIKTDPSIAQGSCRLEANSGQWRTDFDGALSSLKSAFTHGVEDAEKFTPEAEPEQGQAAEHEEDDPHHH